jgi:hypothetical protein
MHIECHSLPIALMRQMVLPALTDKLIGFNFKKVLMEIENNIAGKFSH